jgi:hypothetical protein
MADLASGAQSGAHRESMIPMELEMRVCGRLDCADLKVLVQARFLRLFVAAVIGFGLMSPPAHAAGPLQLKPSPPVAAHIAAFPRVADGTGRRVAARINRALTAAEQGLGCSEGKGSWNRGVNVTMRGPRYLSLLALDDWYCGGAYPDTNVAALVFDLRTGAPIDWQRLFPAGVIQAAGTGPGGGDSEPITVSSAALWELYAKAVAADGTDRDEECSKVMADRRGSGLMLWPAAAADGLGIQQSDFPHVIKACGPPEMLGMPALRKLGLSTILLAAIEEAHRRRWYDRPAK